MNKSNFAQKMNKHWSTTLFALCLCAATTVAGQEASRAELSAITVAESIEVGNLRVFNTETMIDGSTIVVRNFRDQVVDATVSTHGLEPNFAYSIWWAVFNHPEFCGEPNRCSVLDLEINGGDPRVKVSVFWGGGILADEFGTATTSLRLPVGRTRRERFANSRDYGLRNIRNAELHVVLRSHGLAGVAGPVARQLGTANAACPSSGCVNAFASIHRVGDSEGAPE
jgi:hypothetical protein